MTTTAVISNSVVEYEEPHQEADARYAALDVASQPAGLATQMIVQVQFVQVAKYAHAEEVHRPFGNASENRIADLAEQHVRETRRTVGEHHP
jgi:hypothetical protein